MTQDSYFGQNGVITFMDGSTEIDIGIVQNWKAELSFDMNELYGMGSIVYQGIARSKMKAEVTCEFCSFDITQLGKIVDPDYSGSGVIQVSQRTSSATNGDTTKVHNSFKFTGEFKGQNGQTQTIEVGGIYFDNFPWDASNDDWVKLNLTGHGNSYKITPSGSSASS